MMGIVRKNIGFIALYFLGVNMVAVGMLEGAGSLLQRLLIANGLSLIIMVAVVLAWVKGEN